MVSSVRVEEAGDCEEKLQSTRAGDGAKGTADVGNQPAYYFVVMPKL